MNRSDKTPTGAPPRTAARLVRTLRTDAARALAEDAGWNARAAARRVTQLMDAALAPAGLSSIQFGLLCLVASATDDRLAALSERSGLDPSTLSRQLDALARLGWVEIAAVETDRRRRAVWLTETGALLLDRAMPVWREAQAGLGPLPSELRALSAG